MHRPRVRDTVTIRKTIMVIDATDTEFIRENFPALYAWTHETELRPWIESW